MAINKIIVDGVTKIDLSQDTVTANKVLEGFTFHDATGSLCTGTMKQSTGSGSVDVGDLTLYTKLAYTYEEYITNSSTLGLVTAYHEDGTSSTSELIYLVVLTNSIQRAYNYEDCTMNSFALYEGQSIYVVSTKKITNIDVEFGGGCGC